VSESRWNPVPPKGRVVSVHPGGECIVQTRGQTAGQTGQAAGGAEEAGWQVPLEADPADAGEQARDVVDETLDPEAPAAAPPRVADLDLTTASEADLAEQLHEVPFDDDGER
jgi:hypothetical protein